MNNFYLKNNPIVFQGENKINKLENYFEGWYFKNSFDNITISFIPGINITDGKKSSFIQIITNNKTHYIDYKFEDFYYTYKPFSIQIKDNYFSENKIILSINSLDVKISGELFYSNTIKLSKKFMCPNIMGPFSYIPFMECNHAILSLKHLINGTLQIDKNPYIINNGTGYIEKDWGTSFPSSYLWCQGNCFNSNNSSFFLSIATIPFKKFSFTGFICVLHLNNKEYKFTTYNCSRIELYKNINNCINIILSHGKYKLSISIKNKDFSNLIAPQNGNMCVHVSESINSEIKLTLSQNNNIIFEDFSTNCGVEIKNN